MKSKHIIEKEALRSTTTTMQKVIFLCIFYAFLATSTESFLLRSNNKSGANNDLVDKICETGMTLWKTLVGTDIGKAKFWLKLVCEVTKVQRAEICTGLADQYAPDIVYILWKSKLKPDEICSIIFNRATVHGHASKYLNWTIDLPEKIISRSGVKSNSELVYKRILHISDIHLDPLYSPGSIADCGDLVCCHADTVGAKSKRKAGYWGTNGLCDSSKQLVEKFFQFINQSNANDYDLIYWTGDDNAHDRWQTTKESYTNVTQTLTNLFLHYLTNGKNIFSALGNHEGLPADEFPTAGDHGPNSTVFIYETLANQWSSWLDETALRTIRAGGFYSKLIEPKLKLISLNTNICSRINLWNLFQPIDHGDQLKWLVEELYESEMKNQFVHIIGHIAPDKECLPAWLHNYIRIIERFNETIKGSFFGHTHRDEYKLYYKKENLDNPLMVTFIGPSVVNFNPAYKIYKINDQYETMDFDVYFLNITEANAIGANATLKWKHEYSAKEAYGIKSFDAMTWHKFFQQMETNETLHQKYYQHTHRFSDTMNPVCDEKCKQKFTLGTIKQIDPY